MHIIVYNTFIPNLVLREKIAQWENVLKSNLPDDEMTYGDMRGFSEGDDRSVMRTTVTETCMYMF